jgi:TrmH family RNA methyltransferase
VNRIMPIRFVLVRPVTPGNVGATARALKNMGFESLWIVDPAVHGIAATHEARYMAHGAEDVLARAHEVRDLDAALAGCRWVVGTSRRTGRDRLAPLAPRDFAAAVRAAAERRPLAILFGSEEDGLARAELARCHDLVRIPAARDQPSLNLAQAVLVVAYELAMAERSAPSLSTARTEAPAEELEAMFEHLRTMLLEIGYLRAHSGHVRLLALRRLLTRARPTPVEVRLIRGICRRTLHAVRRRPAV